MRLKKGDRVKVIAGKDKGVVGEIIAIDRERERVTVQGVNIAKHHVRDTANPATGATERAALSAPRPRCTFPTFSSWLRMPTARKLSPALVRSASPLPSAALMARSTKALVAFVSPVKPGRRSDG